MTNRHLLQILLTIVFLAAAISIWGDHGWRAGGWPIIAAAWMNLYYWTEGSRD